jgi:hypothetical protein
VPVGLVACGALGVPRETLSSTVEPLRAWPPGGCWATTVPAGCAEGTWNWTAPVRPDLASWVSASPSVCPTTFGTMTTPVPFETLIRIDAPFAALAPAAGSCAVTVPAGWFAKILASVTLKPAVAILSRAVASVRPIAFGTMTVAGPCETRICTVEPFFSSLPSPGKSTRPLSRRC